ncbi:sister chromatid cohesion C-terminus-domain-containing protein [Phlebopus sp. FC_14]|nr:sister chromatid cohesion C-terminus-domain-containing protein [Phlebopus sp. FC_14]
MSVNRCHPDGQVHIPFSTLDCSPDSSRIQPGYTPNAVHEAQSLFTTYPLVSATPSAHVGQHLSNLAVATLPPTYMHYNLDPASYQPPLPPGIRPSSSSLAFALGNPNRKANGRGHKPEESRPFFKDFLDRSAQLIDAKSLAPRKNMAYVSIPASSWRTPAKHSPLPSTRANVKSSARRTGDRDERAPLEKLLTLVEDIFEAEDSLAVDVEISDLPKEFFSAITADCSRPQLQHNVMRKLTKLITQLARPSKRTRHASRENGVGDAVTAETLSDVESSVLSRLIKIIERSVKAGEDLDPFLASVTRPSAPSSPTKSPTKTKKNWSTDVDMRDLSVQLEVARDSILAAECCIALLSSDGLTRQLYSEELIAICLNTVKNQLTRIVFPFVEGVASSGFVSSQLQCLYCHAHPSYGDLRKLLSELFQALSAVLPRVNALFSAEGIIMSDAIIIQAVYIAIGPFFVVETAHEGDGKGKKDNVVLSTLGSSAMRGFRLDALSIIRSIFASYQDQRSWIIEEILSSLLKLSNSHKKAGQFRLRDGRSIRTVSALLLQLVQTSARDVCLAARRVEKARQNNALGQQDSSQGKTKGTVFEELDAKEVQLYLSGLEPATNAAKTVVLFLTQRSGKSKQTKNSNETEYRAILDNLISDLLAVLYWPEWPAASLTLSVICKFLVASLDDVKTSVQTDTNGIKAIALDHLGVIAARIRTSSLKVRERSEKQHAIVPLDEIIPTESILDLETLQAHHDAISSQLAKRASDDQGFQSARELTAAIWGQELATALKTLHSTLHNGESEGAPKPNTVAFCRRLQGALSAIWQDRPNDVFDTGSQEEISRVDLFAEEIGTVQSLRGCFGSILNVILSALDAPPVFVRTKALRALSQIVISDPGILSMANVRRAIESHLLDSSPAVRDAAVELIGRYMVESPDVAANYYPKIADRIADTGVGVRKRVIKLLKQYYGITEELSCRIDISTRLVLRILDEDDTVKDLAIKAIEDLWFQTCPLQHLISKNKVPLPSQRDDKASLLSKVPVIMGVSANFRDRQSPLENLLHTIMSNQTASDGPFMRARYSEICETLIDGLVDASDLPGFTVQSCTRTLYLFATAYPLVLSGTNASTLLPYLKNPATAEELSVSDYLLRVFRISIPHMPKTAVKFGQELQLILQPMIVKPSNVGGIVCLQESVACLCVAVQHLTHDFHRLIALLKSCNARLQQAIHRPSVTMDPAETRMLSILIFIVSLLGEHSNFDHLRHERAEFATELRSVSEGPIVEHIYNSLLALYTKYPDTGLKGRILQCLGFLFRAQPSLMTLERSAGIMDAIFSSSDEESQGRLLRIMQDFLISEAAKHEEQQKESAYAKKERSVDIAELVGNTDGFADSGVSSAIIQRYIAPILDAALSQNSQVQAIAVDILTFTVKQGLAHPLQNVQSFPIIVALETSPVAATSARANALHAILYGKHTTLLNSRFLVSARKSFEYQKAITPGNILGYHMQPEPAALLQRWYTLVREKRTARQDFLKALVKSFDVSPVLTSSQDDVEFSRYMAENLATLEYKTQEEVLTVIKQLTSILSTSGMQLLEAISPSHLLAQLHEHEAHSVSIEPPDPTKHPHPALANLDVMRTSVIIGIIMLLKAFLKALYGLSEEKCTKFIPGKKSTIGDKPAMKRHTRPITWERLPYAVRPLLLPQDLTTHRATFLQIWNEDGVVAEPEEDFQ